MMAAIPPAPTIGFETTKGLYVCRDEHCVRMIAAKGDMIERVVKPGIWTRACDFCHEPLGR